MSEFLATASIWLPGVLAMLALVGASGFFSASETALFYLSREELRRMQSGHASERLAASLMRDPDRLLTVVLFWNLIVNLTYFAVNLVTAKHLIAAQQSTAAVVIGLVGVAGLILLGEVGPKSLAVLYPRPIAVVASVPLVIASRLLDPVLPLFRGITTALRRAMAPNLVPEPYLQIEDIERAIETSELGGEMVRLEQLLLSRLLELSDMTARELMRPRGTYPVWQSPVHLEHLRQRGLIPELLLICGADRDTIEKALPLYELSQLPQRNLEAIADNVIYVPWCETVASTLATLRRELVSVACVVNEYGETIGILTEEDILDTVLNPTSNRAQRLLEREPVVFAPDGRIIAHGLASLRNLASRLDLDYEVKEDSPVTITALLHDELARFPQVGDTCEWQGYRVRVTHAGEPGDPLEVELTRLPGITPLTEPE
ncbi:CNNM domain-containing protein [Planctomicrobium sp. SH664]|uniref:CNNM domain-containing protein n=1 Tax=Planctomicrobium sp. SH664 TaxID=3448125 RepID=UPI003F5B18D5